MMLFSFAWLVFLSFGLTPTVLQAQDSPPICKALWPNGLTLEKNCRWQLQSTGSPALLQITWPGSWGPDDLLEIDLKMGAVHHLKGMEFRLSAKGERLTYRAAEIPLFADPHFNWIQNDLTQKIRLSRRHFNKTVGTPGKDEELTLYLESHEGQSLTFELLSVSVRPKLKPKKGFVSITFDDGYNSNYKAAEILKGQGLKGTAYLIRNALGQKNYLTQKQSCQMSRWGWALSFHHETPLTELENLTKILEEDQKWLSALCPGKTQAQHLAYPLGRQSPEVRAQVAKHFQSARLASGGLESLPPSDPLTLRSFNVRPQTSHEELLRLSKEALAEGDWLILMFHRLAEKPQDELEYGTKAFQAFARGLKAHRAQVLTVPEVMALLPKSP